MKTLQKFAITDDEHKEEQLLQLLFIHRRMSPKGIAHYLRKDLDEITQKLIDYDIMLPNGNQVPGTFMGMFTGRLHYAKADLIAALSSIKQTKKVLNRTDELYAQNVSINAKIIKQILLEMESQDRDSEELSAGAALGMTRKETWVKGAHFGVVMHDIDMVYSERIDYLLKRIIERKDEFYFDDHSNPENWYPHRTEPMFSEYVYGRTYGKEELERLKKTNKPIRMI